MTSPRLASLAEVAEKSTDSQAFWLWLRDFLDGFYTSPQPAALAQEPLRLRETLPEGNRLDAYLAAVAEHLATTFRLRIPAWTQDPSRILRQPYFALNTHEGRMFLIVDSPIAFRARNIFVSADALSRI